MFMIRRISTKWVLAVLGAVIVPFVGFAWFVNVKVSGVLAGDVVNNYLQTMASDLAERIDETIDERRRDAEILAGVQLVSWMVEDLVDDNPFEKTVQVLFDNLVKSGGDYDYVLALTPEGQAVMTNSVYADGIEVPDELLEYWASVDHSQGAWFDQVLEEGEALIDFHQLDFTDLALGEGRLAGGYYLGIARRIESYDSPQETVGVLLTLMPWAEIQTSLDRYGDWHSGSAGSVGQNLYDSSYAWLWSSDADTIIGHPDRSLYGQRVTTLADGALEPLSRAALQAEEGLYPEYSFRGVSKKAAFTHCNDGAAGGLGWIVGVGVDDEDIFGPVRELGNWLITTSGLILLLAGAFSIWIARRTTRPLRDLEDAVGRVGSGDLEARIDVRSADELGQLAQSFNRMTEELQEAQSRLVKAEKDAAWREMARQVAHEIKNPLTPISLSAGLLERSWEEKSDEFGEILSRTLPMIRRQVEVMREVVRDFYTFAGEHKDPRPVPLGLLLDHVIDLHEAQAKEVGVQIHAPSGIEDVHVHADPDELQRAVLNLVANAIDAMPDGGELRITVDASSEPVVLRLRDTGTGLDPEVEANLFEPYFTTRTSGTGLGLAIVRRVVEDLGGRVTLENAEDGPGAVATVHLPGSSGR